MNNKNFVLGDLGTLLAPQFGLEDSVCEATMGRSFAELRALYDRMIWIDTWLEAQDSKRHLSEAL
jgi:hypothetical protein